MQTAIDLQNCIASCRQCHDVCIQTLSHCVERGERHVQPAHIRLLLDCIDICNASVSFMLRGSDLHHATCTACAEICEWCAGDCERLADDDQMRTCAEICRACARSCREMAAAAAFETEQPSHEEISLLAEKLSERDGRPTGKDQDYWFRAEHILRERRQAQRDSAPATTSLRQITTENVETASPDTSLMEAAERMRSRNIGSLPVCEGDRLVGIVTDRDIVIRAIANRRDINQTKVRDVMSSDIVCCFEGQSAKEAEELMQEQQIRRLPIINRDNRLVGIVSIGDLATRVGAAAQRNVAVTLESVSLPPITPII
jgi:CBS domain-containing protein